MTTVRIPWSQEFDNKTKWNEVCAWAVEYFGLPGARFSTKTDHDYMDFIFENPQDALLMSLKWNARVVTEDELTIELVGKFINA